MKMRFMMFMYPGIKDEANWEPDVETVAAMGKYNEQLRKAGMLLSLDGLHPASEGARVTFSAGKGIVSDGPFTETKELIGGYWLIEAESQQEALDWATRCPAGDSEMIEVRRVYEMSDFSPEVQEAGKLSGELPQ